MKEFTKDFIGDEIKGTVKKIKLNWVFYFYRNQISIFIKINLLVNSFLKLYLKIMKNATFNIIVVISFEFKQTFF